MKTLFLVAIALTAYAPFTASAMSTTLETVACPDSKEISAAKPSTNEGQKLRQGIVYVEQGRHTAAYTLFQEAISEGVSDPIERASAYRQMALLMCRLGASEACETNFSLALLTAGSFEINQAYRNIPGVQQAFDRARRYFVHRCVPNVNTRQTAERAITRVAAASNEHAVELARVSLTMVSSANERSGHKAKAPKDAILLIRVKPWARVSIDGKEVVTPPIKTLKIRPGEREISINHPLFSPILIEGNFRAGETWVVQQSY